MQKQNITNILKTYGISPKHIDMYILHVEDGLSFSQIGHLYNISRQRVCVICNKLQRLLGKPIIVPIVQDSIPVSQLFLSTRVVNALSKAHIFYIPHLDSLLLDENISLFSSIKGISFAGVMSIIKAVFAYEQEVK